MSTTTTRLSLLKPDPTEVANYITSMNENWDKLDAFATFERLAAFPGSPLTGKSVIKSNETDQPYWYNGTSWVPMERYFAPVSAIDTTTRTTTSTSFTALTELSLTITARKSGCIYVTVGGELVLSTSGNVYLSYEIRETNISGAIVQAASDRRGIETQDTANAQISARFRTEGLTPEAVYYVRAMARVSAGTGSFYRRILIAEH